MSIASNFPEIEAFFRKRRFTEHDLVSFDQELIKKYAHNEQLLKAAREFVRLQLFKYEILDRRNKPQEHLNNILTNAGLEGIAFTIKEPFTVSKLAFELMVPVERMRGVFKSAGINSKDDYKLTCDDLRKISSFILSKKRAFNQQRKQVANTKIKPSRSNNSQETDNMAEYQNKYGGRMYITYCRIRN